MIDRGYCVTMARYNMWENKQLDDVLKHCSEAVVQENRGAFFGSILGTLNHLLWGDTIWMSRFGSGESLGGGIKESTGIEPTYSAWSGERFRMDGRIRLWADGLNNVDLKGDLTWYSGSMGHNVTNPVSTCVVHFFNHQTHHRGQVHAMMTAAGLKAPVSDLVFMPEAN